MFLTWSRHHWSKALWDFFKEKEPPYYRGPNIIANRKQVLNHIIVILVKCSRQAARLGVQNRSVVARICFFHRRHEDSSSLNNKLYVREYTLYTVSHSMGSSTLVLPARQNILYIQIILFGRAARMSSSCWLRSPHVLFGRFSVISSGNLLVPCCGNTYAVGDNRQVWVRYHVTIDLRCVAEKLHDYRISFSNVPAYCWSALFLTRNQVVSNQRGGQYSTRSFEVRWNSRLWPRYMSSPCSPSSAWPHQANDRLLRNASCRQGRKTVSAVHLDQSRSMNVWYRQLRSYGRMEEDSKAQKTT